MKKILMIALHAISGLLLFNSLAWAQLTSEQEAIKDKGMFLYNMIRGGAGPFLEVAAQAGDSESQYYLAEDIRQDNMHMTPEAQRLYEAAANQGDIYAMMRLTDKKNDLCVIMGNCSPDAKTPQEWWITAKSLAEKRARQGDPEAMYQLFFLTGQFDWLTKSAAAGFAEGQDWLASLYREGVGTFLIPGNRKKEVEKWLKASAESGYAPGMVNYAGILKDRGDAQGFVQWMEKAAEAGHFGAMSNLAGWTAHMPNAAGYPLDLVKAYGLTLLMAEAEPSNGPHWIGYGEQVLPKVAAKMTPEQIEAGKAYAKEWAKTHPPLSRFPPKFGY